MPYILLVIFTKKVGFLRAGTQRDRIYLYDQYVRILDKETEPLPR